MERVPHRVAFRPHCNFNFFFYCFWTEFFLTTLSKLLEIRRFLFIGKNWECKFFKSKWCFCLLLNLCRLLLENADKLKISWIKIICEENIAPELWLSPQLWMGASLFSSGVFHRFQGQIQSWSWYVSADWDDWSFSTPPSSNLPPFFATTPHGVISAGLFPAIPRDRSWARASNLGLRF